MNTFEYIKNEVDKIIDIKVNGKPVKRSSMRGWKKAQETSYFIRYTAPVIFENPWSGVQVELNPLEASVYEFCDRWYKRYSALRQTEVPVQTYDDMKYFLLELNSQAYMDLID